MRIKLIDFGYTTPPTRMHPNDTGADVYAPGFFECPPHKVTCVPLGFGIEVPAGYTGLIFPRSSMAKAGLICQLPPIDPGYTGQVHAIIANITDETQLITPDQRIGQLVLLPTATPDFDPELCELRKAGAFGSTGV